MSVLNHFQRYFANGRTASALGKREACKGRRRQGEPMGINHWNLGTRNRRWWLRLLAFGAVAGALLAVLGPFGSYLNGRFSVLLAHWVVTCTLGCAVTGLAAPPLIRLAQRRSLPLLPATIGTMALLAAPIAALSALEARWLWPRQTSSLTVLDWYAQALMVSLLLVGSWILLELALHRRSQPASTMTTPVPASLASTPAAAANTESPLCLQMEDHYVRIHRAAGSSLELLSFQDAIARYGRDGLQVHRSWWVNTRAVRAAERDGRNWRLRLSNDLLVPVARNRVAAVRASGLMDESAESD